MMPRGLTISVALLLLITVPACFSGWENEKSKSVDPPAARKQAAKPSTAADVDRILANSENETALSLYQAAATAVSLKRRDDAAFLLFAAQIRARGDVKAFPPVGTGANSPGVALTALSRQIGNFVNPAIMRDRGGYSRVVARLERWKPKYDVGYVPGWEFKNPLPLDQCAAAAMEFWNINVAGMRGMNTLFQNDEYHGLIRKIQDYNLDDDFIRKIDDGQFPPSKVSEADFKRAKARAEEIEKQMGIEGLFYEKPN
jgi:hypothetical protein